MMHEACVWLGNACSGGAQGWLIAVKWLAGDVSMN